MELEAPAQPSALYIEPFVGWRFFRLGGSVPNPTLVSITCDYPWKPGRNIAECVLGHRAPHPACHCGLYAFKNEPAVAAGGHGYIAARVELWGLVAEHQFGYRAEYGRIVDVYDSPHHDQLELCVVATKYLGRKRRARGIPYVSVDNYGRSIVRWNTRP